MHVLPPFADEPAPDERQQSPHARPYFFFAGRLEAIKGLQSVIPRMPDVPGVDLLVAGAGSFRNELERLSGSQVRFLGSVDSPTLARYYRHAVATVVPSITFETFGLTVIESFASGTPVVARRLGPLPETVTACGGGLLFSDDDELVTALETLSSDSALRNRLGANARRGFETKWSESAVVPRYLELVTAAMSRT